ncbi:Uncharacterized protein dnm_004880 [Desulfonema magnum]|uniref:Uncharacterized protein n=1 Tax=Desulfonema magnum TaxID=45655 RepID=A0A975GKA0_9BACT|nr:Uncharacterized protein dnm_004880 [Desulfonema magnum]
MTASEPQIHTDISDCTNSFQSAKSVSSVVICGSDLMTASEPRIYTDDTDFTDFLNLRNPCHLC